MPIVSKPLSFDRIDSTATIPMCYHDLSTE